jgi:molybdopterin synthase catalytic subunit
MFSLSDTPLDSADLRAQVLDPACGAVASFEGLVRNHHEEKSVDRLEYEAHPVLAGKEGRRVLIEARDRFDISHAVVVHRTGSLAIGDLAIVIYVSSAHRAAAFDACRFLIDEIKQRVPIWKREHYTDGTVAWVEQCEGCSSTK